MPHLPYLENHGHGDCRTNDKHQAPLRRGHLYGIPALINPAHELLLGAGGAASNPDLGYTWNPCGLGQQGEKLAAPAGHGVRNLDRLGRAVIVAGSALGLGAVAAACAECRSVGRMVSWFSTWVAVVWQRKEVHRGILGGHGRGPY